jgi:hypothetical protein
MDDCRGGALEKREEEGENVFRISLLTGNVPIKKRYAAVAIKRAGTKIAVEGVIADFPALSVLNHWQEASSSLGGSALKMQCL